MSNQAAFAKRMYKSPLYQEFKPELKIEILNELIRDNSKKLVDNGYPKALREQREELVAELVAAANEMENENVGQTSRQG